MGTWEDDKSFCVVVIAICPHGDHMVGLLPREWRWCTLCVNESDEGEMISIKRVETVFRIKCYINPDYYYYCYCRYET